MPDDSSLPVAKSSGATDATPRWEPPSPEELQTQMSGYTIERLIGRGGMGVVYKGVQTNLDRAVAIKILPPGVEQEDPSYAERFRNEARLMAKLNHPAVVAVHDFGVTLGSQLYFAMEYVDGTDVSQMLRTQGKLPPEHALAITAHVCDALAAAHELGIVHRDIKPANVLINTKGQVKVADFGLAKVEEPGTHGLTKTGYAMGTPDFVAPEVLMLGSHIDGRADLYAVGVMLYQMLTGEVPRGAFKPATVRLPGLDPRFDPIILKAMQSDREERYQSSTELRRDLDVILTVPLVRQDEPSSAAIPAAQVAQTSAQRSAAQKPPARSADAPVRQPAKAGEGTHAPAKSKAPLLIGLGAVAAVVIGAFVMFSGSEKAKPSGPLSPLSGTSRPSTPDTSKPSPPKTVAAGPTIASKDAPPQGNLAATTKPGNLPPATALAQSVSKWQRVEPTEARWKELGCEIKNGWVSLLIPSNESQKAWRISDEIKEKPTRDVAVRIRFRKVRGLFVSLNCRYSPVKPWPEAVLWSDGRFQLRNQNTPLGGGVDMKEVKLPKPPAVGDEGVLELAVIGSRVIARLNSTQVLEREVPGMHPAGPFEVRSGGHWIKDAEYMNLEGLADPIKALGWNVSTASQAITSATVTTSPTTSPAPSTPASPSPSLPVSSSPPPATVMASAAPASELDQRLAALDSGFQAAVDRDANAAFKASIVALDKLYLTALDRSLAAASKGGKLEEAIALREEKQRIEKGEGVPGEIDESTAATQVPDAVKTLRKTYRSTVAQHEAARLKAMQPLYDKYDQALAAVQTELTQAQKLDDALRVKTVREQIAATRSGSEGSAGTPARTTSTGGAVAQMTEADKSVRPPLDTATKDKPFTNSLGMKFVPVPDTDILMCIHETRKKDYAAYAAANANVDDTWKGPTENGLPVSDADDHPVVQVNWNSAVAFCTWLSRKDGIKYRLATDREWSYAVGIGRDEVKAAQSKGADRPPRQLYPWGDKWPLPKNSGNYADSSAKQKIPPLSVIQDYDDGYATTAPVMRFKENQLGLYDLGGNVWEWCLDSQDPARAKLNMRGSSWKDASNLHSATRRLEAPNFKHVHVGFRVVVETRASARPSGAATKPATPTPPPPAAPAPAPATAAKSDFTNSLGMKFVKVPGTQVLFCIHETRKGDYAKYAAAVPRLDESWKNQVKDNVPISDQDDHPVVSVSWEEAQAFCQWLSKEEGKTYRLPTDREWSEAVGIGRDEKWQKDSAPVDFAAYLKNEFPWGGAYPPKTKDRAGNYADEDYKAKFPGQPSIAGYSDGYATTAPIMSFKPNKLGIYDMGGNVYEWVEDWFRPGVMERVLRGCSWVDSGAAMLPSSNRPHTSPTGRASHYGFRIVLETRAPASPSGAATKPSTPPPATPAPAPAKSDFTNSLGMMFVKISGTKVLFCIHETRYKDYAAYAAAMPDVNPRWGNQTHKGVAPKGLTDDHPVVIVSWEDAQAFCAWLGQKEGKRYRLPTDEEWSYAAGIGRDEKRKKGDTPGTLASLPNEYPWGTKWPPSKGCENYGDESYKAAIGEARYLTGYDDGYPTTAPVMSFKPSRYGLYDMGGNVLEWCEDWYNTSQTSRALRGSSWKGGAYDSELRLSHRGQATPATREDNYGFRIVLETTE